MATPARPDFDRRRSSSRTRDAQRSVPTSPVGSPPQLQSILKRHPADQERRARIDGPSSPGTGGVEGGIASLAVGDSSAEALSAETSGRDTPAWVATTVDSKTGFIRRVAFNTFDAGEELEGKAKATGGGTGIHYSFTLSAKSAIYCRSRWSRTFLVATDLNEYSVNATNWLLTSFLEDNDEVVVLRVIEPGSSAHNAWRASMEEAKDEAEGVLAYLMKKNGDTRPISVIVEFAIGPIEETIHRMIEIYKPDSLIVGTRGRPDSLFKSAFMGSISRWAVARSPVPVVVVRPDDKVREGLERRLQDQKRGRSYVSLLSEKERKQLSQSQVSVKVTPVEEGSRTTTSTPRPSTDTSSLSASNAPAQDDRSDDEEEDPRAGAAPARTTSSKGNSSSGGGLMAALGFGKKKDKGKEFKRCHGYHHSGEQSPSPPSPAPSSQQQRPLRRPCSQAQQPLLSSQRQRDTVRALLYHHLGHQDQETDLCGRLWLTGDITNFLGSIWQGLIPTVIILALVPSHSYYTVCDVILIFQVFYYRRKRRLHPELYEPLATSDGLNGNGVAALPTPASEQTPLLSAFSAHAPTEPAFPPAVQRARDLLFYGAGIAIIVSAGVIAWFAGKNKNKEGRVVEEWDTSAQIVGWVSAFLYLGSRLPQLALNRKTKCVGLSIFMFLLAVAGNSTYVASILLTSMSPQHLLINAPWLVGSGGTIFLDFIVLGQFAYYAKERRLEAEAAKNGVFAADDDALARREVFEDDEEEA
ncbi:hypothetical protein BJY59DRAFT_760747 [Rhodotorula toruloides]